MINSKRDDEGFRIEHNSSTPRFEKESREVVKGAKGVSDNKDALAGTWRARLSNVRGTGIQRLTLVAVVG
jgi:hypothetical protein